MLTPLFEVNTLGVSLVAWGSFKKKKLGCLGTLLNHSAVGGLFAHLKEAERELDTAREKTPVAVEHTAIGESVSLLAEYECACVGKKDGTINRDQPERFASKM